MVLAGVCFECGCSGHLLRCTRCKVALYCSKDHQLKHWKTHKKICKKVDTSQPTETTKNEALMDGVNKRNISSDRKGDGLAQFEEALSASLEEKSAAEKVMGASKLVVPVEKIRHYKSQGKMCAQVIRDMNEYGMCTIDNFLGEEYGMLVLQEVLELHQKGVFSDGQVVAKSHKDQKSIRSDQTTWISGSETGYKCDHINELLRKVDALITRANKTANNGVLGQYSIKGRTGAMVACYAESGSSYVTHVDNPNRDGRRITAIYYLNREWDVETHGGLLRLFPEGSLQPVDVAPIFDRMFFFWSDRRNPHEVLPTYKARYAITVWYFDDVEKQEACRRLKRDQTEPSTSSRTT